MKNSKTFGILALLLTLGLLLSAAVFTAYVDPFFHYHKPLDSLQYPIDNQRYQNDGIVRNFDYDAVITGTSLTENFKVSEFNALFDANAVKVTYSGGTYEELTSNVLQALEHNPEIRYVLFGLDEWFLYAGKDLILADGEYPTYLYDDDPANDVKYLLNKEILLDETLEVLFYTRNGKQTTSFDDYSSWDFPMGSEAVLGSYERKERSGEEQILPERHRQTIQTNLRKNLVQMALDHPNTQFLYFFPPYSIVNWDDHHRTGEVGSCVEAWKLAAEILMEAPNIQVYSFHKDFDTITNLDNYRDAVHYGAHINSLMLERMARQEYRLTPENNAEHWQQVLDFYQNYDYDALFA